MCRVSSPSSFSQVPFDELSGEDFELCRDEELKEDETKLRDDDELTDDGTELCDDVASSWNTKDDDNILHAAAGSASRKAPS
jgi:hypothetical protein